MPAIPLVTGLLETSINKAIQSQPQLQQDLNALRGKKLVVFLDVFEQGLSFIFSEQVDVLYGPASVNQAKLALDSDTCIIATKVSVLSKLRDTSQLTQLIQSQDLSLIGDITIAQQVSTMAKAFDFDPEEWLATRTTDVFAHSLFSFAHTAHTTIVSTLSLFAQQAAELATEEKPIAARKQAVKHFCSEVGALHNDTARLEARISRLASKLTTEKG